MLHTPTFDTEEFNCLSKTLEAVPFYLEIEEKENRLGELKERFSRAQKANLLDVRRTMIDVAQQLCVGVESQAAEFRTKTAANFVCKTLRGPLTAAHKERLIREQVRQLLPVFVRFDDTLFREVFDSTFPHAGDVENVPSLKSRIGRFDRTIEKMWANYHKCFGEGGVPRRFRNTKLGGRFDEAAMAELVIRSFIQTWRSRAPLFPEPVSVYGASIRQMPHERRLIWMTAYDLLQLRDIPKSVRYLATRPHATTTEAAAFNALPPHATEKNAHDG